MVPAAAPQDPLGAESVASAEQCKKLCAAPIERQAPDPFADVGYMYRCAAFWHKRYDDWGACEKGMLAEKKKFQSFMCGEGGPCNPTPGDKAAAGEGRGVVMTGPSGLLNVHTKHAVPCSRIPGPTRKR